MTITEKHRTEYKLIDQVMSELTQVMQKIEALETDAERNRSIIGELRKISLLYRKALQSLPHRVFVKDLSMAYVFCNDAYARDLAIAPDEIQGLSDRDFFPEEQAEKNLAEEIDVLRAGLRRETEETYAVSGQELIVLATRTPIRNDDGEIIGLQVVLQDVTEERRRADHLAAEFKTLRNLLGQEKANSDTLREHLEKTIAQRDRLEAETRDIQDTSRVQMAIRDAEIDRLKKELQRETTERKDAVELLRKSFTQIQDLMNSVQHVMGPSDHEDQ